MSKDEIVFKIGSVQPEIEINKQEPLYNKDNPPPLVGSSSVLLDQIHKNVLYHFKAIPKSSMSDLRNEVCDRIKHRALFQTRVFGESTGTFDTLPVNSYSGFTVSLYLILRDGSYSFWTSTGGFEVNGYLNEEGIQLLDYFSQGLLPPRMLDDLRKLPLIWYDGGLVCEIDDQRRAISQVMRTLLRVHHSDLSKLGVDCEQDYLFARYPCLCLDPDIKVSEVSRVFARDNLRWKRSSMYISPKQLVQEKYPMLFLKNKHEDPPEDDPPELPEDSAKLLLNELLKLDQK